MFSPIRICSSVLAPCLSVTDARLTSRVPGVLHRSPSLSLFRGHRQETDLTMKTTDTSLKASIPHGPPRSPAPTRCIRPRTTRPWCPSTPRGCRRTLRHLPSACSPSPLRGPHALQVGPFCVSFLQQNRRGGPCSPGGSVAHCPPSAGAGPMPFTSPSLSHLSLPLSLLPGALGELSGCRAPSFTFLNSPVPAWPVPPPEVVFPAGPLCPVLACAACRGITLSEW